MDDAEIAQIIAAEADRRRELTKRSGVLSYLDPLPSSVSVEVNKRFLGNIIREVSSHNRREEEGECWTQHFLEKKSSKSGRKRSDESACGPSKKRRDEPATQRISEAPTECAGQLTSREEWALRKARAMLGQAKHPAIKESPGATVCEKLPHEDRKPKKHMKEKKEKKEHKEKKLKKDKKGKKEKKKR